MTTARVRQELAVLPVEAAVAPPELAALLRAAGTLARGSSGLRLELATGTGATARRAHRLMRALDATPTLLVRDAHGLERRTYGVMLGPPVAASVARHLGLLDDEGRPTAVAPKHHLDHAAAMVRGALLGGGSVSPPGRAPHLELRTSRPDTAAQLADAIHHLVAARASVGAAGSGHRAVLKSGAAIAELLGAIGATSAYLDHEEHLLRRQLRADAQRLTNADAANVRRAVAAASDQVQMVEGAVGAVGWEELEAGLREVALARLANPAASLADIGQLCDPPVGKSAVHRRLARLEELGRDAASGS